MDHTILNAFPHFASLDRESLRLLEQTARTITVPEGTVMFREGSECSSYVLVLHGAIRVQKVAESGREIVLYRVESGQSCVLTTNCLMAHESYSAEGIAETEVHALILPVTTFRRLLSQSECFRDGVFSAYATRITDLLLLIEEVAFGRIDTRLAAWLRQHGGDRNSIKATHQDIATELGTAREVISRQLKEFERKGWVELQRGNIMIRNRDALAPVA